jgi:hypothetical protein
MPYHHYLLNEDVECWIAQFFREYCDCSELPYSIEAAFLQRSFLHYQALPKSDLQVVPYGIRRDEKFHLVASHP